MTEREELYKWLEGFSKRISDEDLNMLNRFMTHMRHTINDLKRESYLLGVEAKNSTKQ